MRTETRPTTETHGERGGWFLRLARQRRWFHEALFRNPPSRRPSKSLGQLDESPGQAREFKK